MHVYQSIAWTHSMNLLCFLLFTLLLMLELLTTLTWKLGGNNQSVKYLKHLIFKTIPQNSHLS